MENERKYSLALVDDSGTVVLTSLHCSPKYKNLNFPTSNCTRHTLKELCFFTFCFRDSLDLRHHLAHTNGCLDYFFETKAKNNRNFEYKPEIVYFAMQKAKLVILDEFGNVVSDSLLFSNEEFKNKFDLNNPLAFFETLIFSKFEELDFDCLLELSKCMFRVLEKQKQSNPSPLLSKRLEALSVFSNGICLFKNDDNNTLPKASLDNNVLRLVLKRIFTTIDIDDVNIKISPNFFDWEIILAALEHYRTRTITKTDSKQDCIESWYNRPFKPRGNRGNKGWA